MSIQDEEMVEIRRRLVAEAKAQAQAAFSRVGLRKQRIEALARARFAAEMCDHATERAEDIAKFCFQEAEVFERVAEAWRET